jgi:hypothetical protein
MGDHFWRGGGAIALIMRILEVRSFFDNEDFGGAIAFWDVRGAIVLMMRVLEE